MPPSMISTPQVEQQPEHGLGWGRSPQSRRQAGHRGDASDRRRPRPQAQRSKTAPTPEATM
jgi:hypothetical protein